MSRGRPPLEPPTPSVQLRLTLSPATLTPDSYVEVRRALRTIHRDAEATAKAAAATLVQLSRQAEALGIRARGRPLEGLSVRADST
jgi:hypothetical protein